MKLLTKTLVAALVATSTARGDVCNSGNPNDLPNPKYQRSIVLSQDRVWPGPEFPLDPNHEAMIASGLYTAADAEAMTQNAIADFHAKYGIDFSEENPEVEINSSTGIRTIPGLALLLPSKNGENKDFFLVSDTEHVSRSHAHPWYNLAFGVLILFLSDGIVPGGTNKGASYKVNDVFSFTDINLLKNNSDLQKPHNREVIKLRTSNLVKLFINQYGNRQVQIILDAFDAEGNQGFYVASFLVVRKQGVDFIEERPLITWECPPVQAE